MRNRSVRLLMCVIGVMVVLACSSCSRNTGSTAAESIRGGRAAAEYELPPTPIKHGNTAEFSAVGKWSGHGLEGPYSFTWRIYVKGGLERQENTRSIEITRPDKDLTWILDPAKKTYFEVKNPYPKLKDVWKAGKSGRMPFEKNAGRAKVAGFICDMYVFQPAKGPAKGVSHTRWFSPELSYDLKIVDMVSGTRDVTEFSSIRVGKQDRSLFEIPAGYRKVKSPIPGFPPGDAFPGQAGPIFGMVGPPEMPGPPPAPPVPKSGSGK